MFTAIIPILCNINPCMLFLLSIEKKNRKRAAQTLQNGIYEKSITYGEL